MSATLRSNRALWTLIGPPRGSVTVALAQAELMKEGAQYLTQPGVEL